MMEQPKMPSLAQSIPFDVVREIFKPYAAPFQPVRKHGRSEFPWYLSHICSSWRSAFLSMHREFWSKYVLYPLDISTSRRERTIIQTKFFLQRGDETNPLSFEILSYIPTEYLCILEMLVAESTRWQNASLYITDEQLEILSPIRNRLPLLSSLIINRSNEYIPASPAGLFENAPLLKYVTLPFLSTWRINWRSLTALRLTNRTEGLLDLLPSLSNLEELKIPYSTKDSVTIDSTMSIVLPRLKNLSISELSFLSILTAPTLKELSIDVERYSVGWYSIPPVLSSFFCHSTMGLKSLTLKDCHPAILATILPYTPQIEFLEVGKSAFCGGPDYFNLLTCSTTMGRPQACRQLKTLKVIVSSPLGVASVVVIPLIKSRTTEKPESVQSLQKLVFVLPGTLDMPDFAPIERQCAASNVQLQFEVAFPS